MQICDVMTRRVRGIRPTDTMAAAGLVMRDDDVGVLPVFDESNVLVGIITDRDLTVRGTALGCDPEEALVRELMSLDVVGCYLDQDISVAADLMKSRQVRRLIVLNRNHELVGIVSLSDLALDEGHEFLAGSTLEAICEPAV